MQGIENLWKYWGIWHVNICEKNPGDAAFFPGDAGDAPLLIKGRKYYPYIKVVRHLRHLGKRLRHLGFLL